MRSLGSTEMNSIEASLKSTDLNSFWSFILWKNCISLNMTALTVQSNSYLPCIRYCKKRRHDLEYRERHVCMQAATETEECGRVPCK